MRTEQVRAVLAVAEKESFRAAAIHLGVGQSTVSAAIARLEAELGVPLLDRTRAGASLSTAGRAALREMQAVCAAEDDLLATIRAFADGATELVRVSCVTASINTLLPSSVSDFVAETGAEVQVHIAGSESVLDDVRAHRADIGLVALGTDQALAEPHLAVEELLDTAVGVVLPAIHPLAQRGSLTLSDVAGERFVKFRSGYLMHRLAGRILSGSAPVRVASHVDSTPDALRLVAAGVGLCIVPEFSVTPADPVVWLPFDDVDERVVLAMVTARDNRAVGSSVVQLQRRIRTQAGQRAHSAASARTTVRMAV